MMKLLSNLFKPSKERLINKIIPNEKSIKALLKIISENEDWQICESAGKRVLALEKDINEIYELLNENEGSLSDSTLSVLVRQMDSEETLRIIKSKDYEESIRATAMFQLADKSDLLEFFRHDFEDETEQWGYAKGSILTQNQSDRELMKELALGLAKIPQSDEVIFDRLRRWITEDRYFLDDNFDYIKGNLDKDDLIVVLEFLSDKQLKELFYSNTDVDVEKRILELVADPDVKEELMEKSSFSSGGQDSKGTASLIEIATGYLKDIDTYSYNNVVEHGFGFIKYSENDVLYGLLKKVRSSRNEKSTRELLEKYVEHGVDFNGLSNKLLLQYAIEDLDYELAQMLLDAGASPLAKSVEAVNSYYDLLRQHDETRRVKDGFEIPEKDWQSLRRKFEENGASLKHPIENRHLIALGLNIYEDVLNT